MITSPQNSKIKETAKLQRKKYRDREQKFLVEGIYPLQFALQNNYPLEELFICTSLFKDTAAAKKIINKTEKNGVKTSPISEKAYQEISSYKYAEGLIATAPQIHRKLATHQPFENAFYIVAVGIEKLSHLGELFRLTDTSGANGIIICDMRGDIFNPHVIRTSLGTFFSVEILESKTSTAIEWFKKNQINIIATSPQAEKPYDQVDLTKPTAIVLGTEYTGLSKEWLTNSTLNVKIPLKGQVSSLSVNTSAAVLAYETIRQRENLKPGNE